MIKYAIIIKDMQNNIILFSVRNNKLENVIVPIEFKNHLKLPSYTTTPELLKKHIENNFFIYTIEEKEFTLNDIKFKD